MPDLLARAPIALGLPPLDLLTYQIHMPSTSNGLGDGTNSGVAIGGATVGVGSCLALACAGRSASTAARAAAAMQARWRGVAGYERTCPFYHGSVKEVTISRPARVKWVASRTSPPFSGSWRSFDVPSRADGRLGRRIDCPGRRRWRRCR